MSSEIDMSYQTTDDKEALRQRLVYEMERCRADVDEVCKIVGLADSIGARAFLKGNLRRVGTKRVKAMIDLLTTLPDAEPAAAEPSQSEKDASDRGKADKETRRERGRRGPRTARHADDSPKQADENPAEEATVDADAVPGPENAQADAAAPLAEPVEEPKPMGPAAWACKWGIDEQAYLEARRNGNAAVRAAVSGDIRVVDTAYWPDAAGKVHALDYLADRDVVRRTAVFACDDKQGTDAQAETRELRVTSNREYVCRFVYPDGSSESFAVTLERARELYAMMNKGDAAPTVRSFGDSVDRAIDRDRLLRD